MNAKRMSNISGILNALFFFPYVYLRHVFVSVCAQIISDSSESRRAEGEREAACTHTCLDLKNPQRK